MFDVKSLTKYPLVLLTAGLLSYGQVCIAKVARGLAFGEGIGALIQSALLNKYFYFMFAVNGTATVGYILLTRRYALQEVFVLNLIGMAAFVALGSHFLLGESLTMRRLAGYVLGILAVLLLSRT